MMRTTGCWITRALMLIFGFAVLNGYAAITDFPFSENFEHGGAMPSAWTNDPADDGDDWTCETYCTSGPTNDHTTGSGYFAAVEHWSPYATNTCLLLPPMDLTVITNPAITYWYWLGDGDEGQGYYLYLESYSNGTWRQVGSYNFNHVGWKEIDASLKSYASTNTQLRFRFKEHNYHDYDVGIDDVTVFSNTNPPPIPSGLQPTNAAAVLPVFGTFHWDQRANLDGHYLYLGTNGGGTLPPANVYDHLDISSNPRYNYDNLDTNTTYYWQLVPYNDNGDNSNAPIQSFTTGDKTTITTFPWSEDFESGGVCPPELIDHYDDNGTGWRYETDGGHATDGDHTSGSGYMAYIDTEFQYPVESLWNNIITPELNITNLTYPKFQFFYVVGTNFDSYLSRMFVYVFHDGAWENDYIYYNGSGAGSWSNVILDLEPYKAEDVRLRIAVMERGNYASDICVDDLLVYDDTNIPVATTAVSPLDGTTNVWTRSNLVWQAAERADNYKLYFGSDGSGTVSPTGEVNGLSLGGATSYIYTNLDYNTEYFWQVIPGNAIGDASNCPIWSFTTYDTPTALPLHDAFDTNFDQWQTQVSGSGNMELSTEDVYEGSHAVCFSADAGSYNIAMSSLTVFLQAATNPMLSFWYRADSGFLAAEIQVDLYDGQWHNNIWSDDALDWTMAAIDLASYDTENGDFIIRIIGTGSYNTFGGSPEIQNAYLDDLHLIAEGDAPYPPLGPSPADNATNQVVFSELRWNNGIFTDAIDLFLGTNQADVTSCNPTVRVIDDQVVEAYYPGALDADTTYYWRVMATNAYGSVTGDVWQFTTETPTVLVPPMTEVFSNALPANWVYQVNQWAGVRWDGSYNSSLGGAPASGALVLEGGDDDTVFYGSSNSSQVWEKAQAGGLNEKNSSYITMYFQGPGHFQLLFDYCIYYNGNNYDINMRIDINEGNGWQQIGSDYRPNSVDIPWTRETLDLGSITAQTFAVRFWSSIKYSLDYSTTAIMLDNIEVSEVQSAPAAPYGPDPAHGETAALITSTLTWQNGTNTETIDLYFSTNQTEVDQLQAGALVTAGADTNEYDPGGMNYSQDYYWRVVAHRSGAPSTTGQVWSFTTQDPAYKALPYFTDFSDNAFADGWSQQFNLTTSLWAESQSTNAGAAAPEMFCDYDGESNAMIRLVSPPLNATGQSRLTLSFLEFMPVYPDTETCFQVRIQTSQDQTNWTDEYIYQPTVNMGPRSNSYSLLGDIGATTYVGFAVTGDLWGYDAWYIDNVQISAGAPDPSPGTPFREYPLDHSLAVLRNVTLTWTNGSHTDSIDLFLSTNETLVEGLDSGARLLNDEATNTCTPGMLTYGATYYWRVLARNAYGLTTTGTVWQFTVQGNPIKQVPYSTDFAAWAFAEGWTQQCVNCDELWYMIPQQFAGGTSPEMECMNGTSTAGTIRLVSPRLDTTNALGLEIVFKQMFNCDAGAESNISVTVQSSADMTNWTDHYIVESGLSHTATVMVRGVSDVTWIGWTIDGDLTENFMWVLDDVSFIRMFLVNMQPDTEGLLLSWPERLGHTNYFLQQAPSPTAGSWTNWLSTTQTTWQVTNPPASLFYRVQTD